MILQALVEHYEVLASKGKIARPGWERVKVYYALEIDSQGNLLYVHLLGDKDGKRHNPSEILMPSRVKKTAGVRANFLCENAAYLLGIGNQDKPERVAECFTAAKMLHDELLSPISHPCAQAILLFFKGWDIACARENPILSPYMAEFEKGVNLTFMHNGLFPHEIADILEVWQTRYDGVEEGATMPCLVTGKSTVPTATHPSIKGVRGAQSSGAALVSFNAPSYCSFGREQNHNAPVGKYAAFAYTTALNHLLSDRKHTKLIGDTTVVYWAQDADDAYQNIFSCALDGGDDTITNEDLDVLMQAISQGNAIPWEGISIKPSNRFYVLGLSPNSARLSVRFFLTDSFENMIKHLKRHYDQIEIVDDGRGRFKNIPLWALLRETVNEKSRDKSPSPQMSGDTLRAILTGGRYPATLFHQTQLRIRAERIVTRGRAAIIKGYLIRNAKEKGYEEVLKVDLNENTTYQPYLLGRLFAVLERAQKTSAPKLETTIKQKYFASACATPMMVFPMLLKLKDHHLRVVSRTSPGLAISIEQSITDLISKMHTSFPTSLSSQDQGIFIIGYYHQTQKHYTKKNDNITLEEEIENA